MMPRVSTRYDNLEASTSEDESSSPFEIDLLNPRLENKSRRIRGTERFSRFICETGSFDSRDTPLTKLPTEQPRCTLAECKNSQIGEISCSDVEESRRGQTGIPRIIRAIRHHSEKLNVNNLEVKSSFRVPRVENSKSSVVVLYDIVKSNDDNTGNSLSSSLSSSSSFLLPSSLSLSKPPPVRVSKSEKTLVTVALPVTGEPTDTSQTYVDTKNHAAILAKTNKSNSPSSRARASLRHQKLTRQRGQQRSVKSNGKNVIRSRRVTNSCDLERERGRNPKERCRTPDCVSRCLMAHRSTYPRQVGTTRGSCDEERPEAEKNSRVAYLMQHMQNHQQEARQRGDTKNELPDDSGNCEKRVFPFQETASGNLKIIPNQVVFESKKVSVLVADPRHTRVNVKAEIGRSEVGTVENESGELVDIQKTKAVETTEYVPRTQPFKSSHNIRPGDMEENQATETIHHRLPLPANEVPLSSLGFTGEQPIDWQNIILPEKTDLYRELARRITNYKNADCIVRLGHDEFHCHLLVLQSYSTYFDEKNYKEVDLTGSSVTSKAFGIIYDWMISPTSDSCHLLRRDNILEIFMAAQQLGIKELEEQCWAFIDNDELFTEDTAFLLYLEARKIGNTAVMELMVPRIMKFFLMLVSTRDFLELSIEELCLLLRSNYICVNSEMEVLMSAVRWLMHDWQSRRQHMIQVLKCVRFGLIAPWQLVDVKRNPENPEFMELMSYPEVQKMVDDGLAFVIIKYWYGNQTEDYYHWIDLLGLTEPTNRNWAGEDKNYVTYREFLLYLEEYQRTKMPELKNRKPTEPRSTNQQKDAPAGTSSTSRKPENGSHESPPLPSLGGGGAVGGHMGPLLLAASNNVGKSDKYTSRMPGSSVMGGQPPPPVPGAPGMAMSPEILGRYLSSFERNAKGTASRNSKERHSNIGGDETPKRTSNIRNANRRPWESSVKNPTASKNHNFDKHDLENVHEYNEGDSCKSEEDAATTIQAIYRGYRARSKFHEIRKSCSEERQKTRKIAELLATGHGNRDNLDKPLEPVRISVSLASRSKNDLRESKIPRRSPSPRKKHINWLSHDNNSAIKDLEGLKLDFARSVPDEIHHHRDNGDSIQTIHRPSIFRNFDDKTSSVSQSDNTDTETDPFSPRPNPPVRIFPRNDSL